MPLWEIALHPNALKEHCTRQSAAFPSVGLDYAQICANSKQKTIHKMFYQKISWEDYFRTEGEV